MTLYGDNTGCVYMCGNEKMSEKTRHIRVKYHFVRELVQENFVQVKYIPTKNMLADLLKKAVSKEVLLTLRPYLVSESKL